MSSTHRDWNHDLRTLLRTTRDSLVPPPAHRVAALDFGDSQRLGESGIAQTTMPDTPSPRGPSPRGPSINRGAPGTHIAALQDRVGHLEEDAEVLARAKFFVAVDTLHVRFFIQIVSVL